MVNIEDIDLKIKIEKMFHPIADGEEVIKYIDKRIRPWIANSCSVKLADISSDSPKWMLDRFMSGNPVFIVLISDDIRVKVNSIINYLNTLDKIKINTPLSQYMEHSELWSSSLKADIGSLCKVSLSDEYFMCKLRSKNEFANEGNLMGHCVSSYYKKYERGEVNIFSLRDSNNKPHLTIEYTKSGKILQKQAKSNGCIKEKYLILLEEFNNITEYSTNFKPDTINAPKQETLIVSDRRTLCSEDLNGIKEVISDYPISIDTAVDINGISIKAPSVTIKTSKPTCIPRIVCKTLHLSGSAHVDIGHIEAENIFARNVSYLSIPNIKCLGKFNIDLRNSRSPISTLTLSSDVPIDSIILNRSNIKSIKILGQCEVIHKTKSDTIF